MTKHYVPEVRVAPSGSARFGDGDVADEVELEQVLGAQPQPGGDRGRFVGTAREDRGGCLGRDHREVGVRRDPQVGGQPSASAPPSPMTGW